MQAYFFTNMYMSGIQNGIQSAHCISDMFIKYYKNSVPNEQLKILEDWAINHKTIKLLNAGYSKTIQELVEDFSNEENPYPWEKFHESKEALNGALTCTSIIIPEKIYEGAKYIRNNPNSRYLYINGYIPLVKKDGECYDQEYTKWEASFLYTINKFGMAK